MVRRGVRLPRTLNPLADPQQDNLEAQDNARVTQALDKAVDNLDKRFRPLDER